VPYSGAYVARMDTYTIKAERNVGREWKTFCSLVVPIMISADPPVGGSSTPTTVGVLCFRRDCSSRNSLGRLLMSNAPSMICLI
jgi:hypothetical protein